MEKDYNEYEVKYIFILRDYLIKRKCLYNSYSLPEVYNRSKGKNYSFSDHIKALIYSLLSNQTKWIRIEPHCKEIDELFFNYDYTKIVSMEGNYFSEGLFRLKCGNIATKKQMNELNTNINKMLEIQNEFGSLDSFVTSGTPSEIVYKISNSNSKYKLKNLGEALAWEYIRNVGIDGAKPDTHLTRFFGSNRMGFEDNHIPATNKEMIVQINLISEKTSMPKCEIDNIIWSFCADGYGEICNSNPKCDICPINNYCNRNK